MARKKYAARVPRVVGLREASVILGVRPSNVRKMLDRYELPILERAAGPVWNEDSVVRLARDRAADERSVATNELRRESALAEC
jgi:hypothetical protein